MEFDNEAVNLMFSAAHARMAPLDQRHIWLTEFNGEAANRQDLVNSGAFEVAVRRLTDLMQAKANADDHVSKYKVKCSEVTELVIKLKNLESNPKEAYENYQRIAHLLQASRDDAARELKAIDAKLAAAGMLQDENSGWGRATLAVGIAIALVGVLFYLLALSGSKAPETKLEVTYDIAAMTQALLLGSGALIAGVAYAVNVMRQRGA